MTALFGLWSCDGDSASSQGPDCRNASQACESGFRCDFQGGAYTSIPERTQTPSPTEPSAGGRPIGAGTMGDGPLGGLDVNGGTSGAGGVPQSGGASSGGSAGGSPNIGGADSGGAGSFAGTSMMAGQNSVGGMMMGSGGQVTGGLSMMGGIESQGGDATGGGHQNPMPHVNLCEQEAGGVCRNGDACQANEEQLQSPCADAGQVCCRMRPPEMGGDMAVGGEMAMGGAMAMNSCVQGEPGINQCVGYFWGHRKCMPDQFGGADANGAQPILAGRDYMGVANYRPGLNTVADWFRIDVCNGGTLTVNIEYPNGGGDLHLLLQGNNLGRLDNSTDICAGRQSVTWTNETGQDAGVQFGVLGFGPPGRQGGENSYSMDVILACLD